MCGILGIVSNTVTLTPDQLMQMRDTMSHRGPDSMGTWWSPDHLVALAHRRLAIIDLSPGGHQPMLDRSGQLAITFNGEIYNYLDLRRELEAKGHSFHTASDTEVILEAYREWDTDCLSHFVGTFAFGLYDQSRHRLFLARDRAGEKPLFYWHSHGQLVFASELKAIMAHPDFERRLDLNAFQLYLAYGFVPEDYCILQGAKKLPQGHAALYDLDADTLRSWQYWQLPAPSLSKGTSTEDLILELENALINSVRGQLIADVPVGILLSGGIDSSLVTAMVARVSTKPVRTFTITFPGYSAHDEAPYARQIAEHFSTQHTELEASPATVDLLPKLAHQYDEPLADSSMVPTFLVSQLIRQDATVALGGDGGDELFGGYWHHSWVQQIGNRRRVIPASILKLGRSVVQHLPAGFKGRNYLLHEMDIPLEIERATVFDAVSRDILIRPLNSRHNSARFSPEYSLSGFGYTAGTPLQRATALDFHSYLVDDILVKVDRASMLTSLEVRAPWLDHRIIELAFSRVPDHLRATASERKILPRLLAERVLPSTMDLTRKQGFSSPMSAWFRQGWGEYMENILAEAEPRLFNQQAIKRLIARQHKGYSNTERLFALTMFELWRRDYRIAV